jgi:hypothetical protein
MSSTRPYKPLISLLFDFDNTLSTDSISAIVETMGLGRDDWTERFERPLGGGWDQILRRGRALIEAGRAQGRPLSTELMREAAGRLRLYDGVLDMPDHLRRIAREIHEPCALEFVVLSSGFAEVIEATEIARRFDRVYASTFHYAEDGPDGEVGDAVCVKRLIAHPEKALYLEAHAKGMDVNGANGPEHAGHAVAQEDMRVPFDQMIYGGDGDSDLQAFGFMETHGGYAVAVHGGGGFHPGDKQTPSQRVENAAPPDYSRGGELMRTLEHAVRACASTVAMRALGTSASGPS